jgi:ribosome recycling factor
VKQTLADQKKRMDHSVEVFEKELETIRTGVATPALLNHLKVEAYGDQLPIIQVGTVSVADGRLLVITPWDRTVIPAIEKAILTSDLGLTPSNDGQVVRLQIPTLTEERRSELGKLVHKKAEEAKVHIRNVRRDAIASLEKKEKSEGLSEDEVEVGKKEAQKLTDQYVQKIDAIGSAKVKEIMTL